MINDKHGNHIDESINNEAALQSFSRLHSRGEVVISAAVAATDDDDDDDNYCGLRPACGYFPAAAASPAQRPVGLGPGPGCCMVGPVAARG